MLLDIVESVEIKQGATLGRYQIQGNYDQASNLDVLTMQELIADCFFCLGYEDLLNYYNLAREIESDLNISFINTEVQSFFRDASGDWNADGQWQGRAAGGWPGGANTVLNFGFRERQPQFGLRGPRPTVAIAGRRPQGATRHVETWAPPEQKLIMFRGGRPGPSNLRRPGHPKSTKRVDFKSGHCQRVFQLDKNHTKKIRMADPETFIEKQHPASGSLDASDSEPSETDTSFLNAVSDAIRRNSQVDLLQLLQTGALRTDQHVDGKHFLNELYALAKQQNLETILPILRVYRAAGSSIRSAQMLKSWFRVRIQIVKAFNVRLTQQGRTHPGGLRGIKCSAFLASHGKAPFKLPSTPAMDLAKVIEFGSGNAALPEYNIDCNPGE